MLSEDRVSKGDLDLDHMQYDMRNRGDPRQRDSGRIRPWLATVNRPPALANSAVEAA